MHTKMNYSAIVEDYITAEVLAVATITTAIIVEFTEVVSSLTVDELHSGCRRDLNSIQTNSVKYSKLPIEEPVGDTE